MFDLMRMDPDSGIYERVSIGECHGCLAGGEVASDRDHAVDTGLAGSRNDGLAIRLIAGVIQMRMRSMSIGLS